MFGFVQPHIHIHSCCHHSFVGTAMPAFRPYPHFMTAMRNQRLNFMLGLALATATPINYRYYPMYNFGLYNNRYYCSPINFMPRKFLGYTANNYNSYNWYTGLRNSGFNNMNFLYTNYHNTNSNNPFGGFNNFRAVSSSMNRTNRSSSSTRSYSATPTYSSTNTTGAKLNRNNNEYGPRFLSKVKEIANRLNCDYKDLLGVMNSESGINARAKNPNGSATGLIQFVESTAQSLGTSTAKLRTMSPIDQLDYVEKYLARAKQNAGISGRLSAGDLYTLVFLPGRANREVVTSSGENYYAHNSGLDTNKDGRITKTELGQRVINKRVSDNSFLA